MDEDKLVLDLYTEYKEKGVDVEYTFVSELVWTLSYILETSSEDVESDGEYGYQPEIYAYMPDLLLGVMARDMMGTTYGVASESFDFDMFESRVSMMHHLGILDYTYKEVKGLDSEGLMYRVNKLINKSLISYEYKDRPIGDNLLKDCLDFLNGYVLAIECTEERMLLEREYKFEVFDEVIIDEGVVLKSDVDRHLDRVRRGKVEEPLSSKFYNIVSDVSTKLYYIRLIALFMIMGRSAELYDYSHSIFLYFGIIYVWREINKILDKYLYDLHVKTYWDGETNTNLLYRYYMNVSLYTLIYILVFKILFIGI